MLVIIWVKVYWFAFWRWFLLGESSPKRTETIPEPLPLEEKYEEEYVEEDADELELFYGHPFLVIIQEDPEVPDLLKFHVRSRVCECSGLEVDLRTLKANHPSLEEHAGVLTINL